MKIKVADLEPNPFREIGKYPIDKRKVESLKLSIRETTFWDNVLCRRKGDVFEIAYGHHRLQALRALGIKEVDIPVRKLTDAQMIRIMAEENLEWLTSPVVINQTVMVVKAFLDGIFAKFESFEALNRFIKGLTDKEHFHQLKDNGVGQITILKFLGGNWKQWMIQSALKTDSLAKEGKLDPKAVVVFDKIDHADKFKAAVIELEVPVKEQLKIAKKVRENIDEKRTSSQGRTRDGKTKTSIADDVADLVIPIPNLKAPKKRKRKALPNIVEFVFKCESDTDNLNRRLEALMPEIEEISKTRLLGRLIPGLKQLGKTISQLTTECEKARTQNGKNKKAKAMAIA